MPFKFTIKRTVQICWNIPLLYVIVRKSARMTNHACIINMAGRSIHKSVAEFESAHTTDDSIVRVIRLPRIRVVSGPTVAMTVLVAFDQRSNRWGVISLPGKVNYAAPSSERCTRHYSFPKVAYLLHLVRRHIVVLRGSLGLEIELWWGKRNGTHEISSKMVSKWTGV